MKKNHKQFLQKISSELKSSDEIPLFGNSETFNFENVSTALAEAFAIDDLAVRLKKSEWKEKDDLKVGMKGKTSILPIYISSIDAPLYWVMPKTDSGKLSLGLFSKTLKTSNISSSLQDGFYRYLLLEAINAATKSFDPIQQMSLTLEEECDLPEENSLCIDLEISFQNTAAWGRLIITETFRKNWVQHFSAFPPIYVPNRLSEHLPVEIGIKIGSVSLSSLELGKLKKGDFILPDILAKEGLGTLVFGQTPLFQVEIDQNQIKLFRYAFNVEDSMENSEISPADNLSQKLETVEKESRDIKEIPLHISVEIARLKIPLDHLMGLSPGNFLELPPLADKKISLIANGQKIGVAELVQLGETLGLKLLEI